MHYHEGHMDVVTAGIGPGRLHLHPIGNGMDVRIGKVQSGTGKATESNYIKQRQVDNFQRTEGKRHRDIEKKHIYISFWSSPAPSSVCQPIELLDPARKPAQNSRRHHGLKRARCHWR